MALTSTSSKFTALTKHILISEGKTSSDARDTAAKCYTGGIHTNKGITFCTFKSLAEKAGITPVTHDRFLKLTDADVAKFIYLFYQDIKGDQLPDSVALAATEAAWGSGPGRALQHLRDSVVDLGKPARTTTAAIKAAATLPERKLFDAYQARREAFLRSLGQQPAYSWALKGWLNRLKRFNATFRPIAAFVPLFFLGITLLTISRLKK